jgi:anthranilate synthase/aminodeoxychorismate synthase-like glutamine amidotransferase
VILIVDNYDSFTYNLVQTIGALGLGRPMRVIRNDAHDVETLASWRPRHLIISPGPRTPEESGISVELIRRLAGKIPILGVCLGHQCIAAAYHARIVRASRLMHGKTSPIRHDGLGVYAGLCNPFIAARYHSLTVDPATLSDELTISAWTDRDELMGIRHKTDPIEGVQYHPESFLTEHGSRLLANFLRQ